MHFALNAQAQALDFELPPLPALALGPWRRVLDTSYDPPQDLHAVRHVQDIDAAPLAPGPHYRVQGRSVAALFVRVGLAAPRTASAVAGPAASDQGRRMS
jgi:hypothetical protein